MAGAQCREVGREGGAADFAELCIAGVSEGAARTAGGRGQRRRAMARCRASASSSRWQMQGKPEEGRIQLFLETKT